MAAADVAPYRPFPASDPAPAQSISADEIALYDRQIRLWGVQAQERIRTANVLLLGAKALANEVAKNLVLAGVNALTIVDHEVVTEDDLGAQFFVSDELVGQNRAEAAAPAIRRLNPRVTVTALATPITSLLPDFFLSFNLIIVTDLSFRTLFRVNAATRVANRPFYAAGTMGTYGFIFADLIQHRYVIERDKANMATVLGPESGTRSILSSSTKREGKRVVELVEKQELYSPLLLANSSPLAPQVLRNTRTAKAVTPLLACLRALWDFEMDEGRAPDATVSAELAQFTRSVHEKHKELRLPVETLQASFLRSFLQNLGAELAPVTAFLGGLVSQDAINVLGGREQPIQNMVLFDGEEDQGQVFALHPMFGEQLDPGGVMAAANMGPLDLVAGLDAPMAMDGSMLMMEGTDMSMAGMNAMDGMDAAGMGMGPGMSNMGAINGTEILDMDMTGMINLNGMTEMVDMTGVGGSLGPMAFSTDASAAVLNAIPAFLTTTAAAEVEEAPAPAPAPKDDANPAAAGPSQ